MSVFFIFRSCPPVRDWGEYLRPCCCYCCCCCRRLLLLFLVADTQLYKRLCPSVGRLVGRLVGRSVGWSIEVIESLWENAHIRPCPPVRNWWPCIWPCFFLQHD